LKDIKRQQGGTMLRRSFLAGSTAAGLAVSARDITSGKVRPGDIPKRVFGKTGQSLTIIGQAGGRFPLCTFDEAKAVTLRAYELGINYFDNARIYWDGRSEEVYGAVLPPFRKEIFLTTKSPQRSRQGAEADLEKSLRALKTDHVDLWQIHQVSEMDEVHHIFAPGGAIEAFEAAKKAGKCRFIGFTGHHDPEVHLAMLKNYDKYDTILMPLHAADASYLSFEKNVLPIAVQRGMGIQAMKSTANAKLLQGLHLKECISYTLSLPVHCLALGCTTVGQIEDDVRIARDFRPLTGDQMAELRDKAAALSGPQLEDWKRNVKTASAGTHRDGDVS
jgi:predicted aldo/keto reductase-like oxidoreductase